MKRLIVILLYLSPDQKSLVEYEIEKAVLNITSVHDKSRAYVRIVFRRKIEYHITNTFLQVLHKQTDKIRVRGIFQS